MNPGLVRNDSVLQNIEGGAGPWPLRSPATYSPGACPGVDRGGPVLCLVMIRRKPRRSDVLRRKPRRSGVLRREPRRHKFLCREPRRFRTVPIGVRRYFVRSGAAHTYIQSSPSVPRTQWNRSCMEATRQASPSASSITIISLPARESSLNPHNKRAPPASSPSM